MNAEHRDDLEWLAFRYVAAELSPAEYRAFESRLEHDQEARQAVGRLVEMTCAVRALDWNAASRAADHRQSRPWYRHRNVQVTAGLALGLMIALMLWRSRGSDQAELGHGELGSLPPAAELAVVWSNARMELDSRPDDDAAAWRWLLLAEREADDPAPAAEQSTAEEATADTPDWMVSAVVTMESEGRTVPSPGSKVEGI